MFSPRPAFVVAAFFILHLQLPSQAAVITERAAGAGAIESYYCPVEDELGAIEIVHNEPQSLEDRAEIEWRVFAGGTAAPVYKARLPFHSGGAIQRIDECRFLVSGFRYFSLDPAMGVGVICRIRLVGSGSTIVIDEQVAIEPDPEGMLWDREQGRLYVHDAQRGKILAASWTGWPKEDATPCLPKSQELVEIASLDAVAVLRERRGRLRHASLVHGGGVLFGTEAAAGASSLYQICPLGPVWTVRELGVPRPAMWRVENEELQGIDEIVVVAPELGSRRMFGVVDLLSGETVAVGEVPPGSRSATVSLPERFRNQPGSPFKIVGEGLRPSNVLFGLMRLGQPIPSPSGTLTECILPAGAGTVGNARDFALGTQLWFSNGSMRVSLHLGFALRHADEEIPVFDVGGGAALLDAELELAIPYGSTDLSRFVNDVSRAIPIGTDAALAGSVAFWQWVAVFADGSLACSDVVGHSIWPQWVGPDRIPAALRHSAEAQLRWRSQLEKEGFRADGVFQELVKGLRAAR